VLSINLKIPATEEEIRSEVSKFRDEIKLRKGEIELFTNAMRHYQKICKHPGQKTGWDRDGSWASPCVVCGDAR
jgi:hypothetical protein